MNRDLWRRIITRSIAMAVAAVLLGVAFNHASPIGVRWKPAPEQPPRRQVRAPNGDQPPENGQPAQPSDKAEFETIGIEDALALAEAGGALLVDTRTAAAFRAGHIPGAVSLPMAGLQDKMPEFMKQYDVHTPLLLYCDDPGCGVSEQVARELIDSYGYVHVMIIVEGYDGWQRMQVQGRGEQ